MPKSDPSFHKSAPDRSKPLDLLGSSKWLSTKSESRPHKLPPPISSFDLLTSYEILDALASFWIGLVLTRLTKISGSYFTDYDCSDKS